VVGDGVALVTEVTQLQRVKFVAGGILAADQVLHAGDVRTVIGQHVDSRDSGMRGREQADVVEERRHTG